MCSMCLNIYITKLIRIRIVFVLLTATSFESYPIDINKKTSVETEAIFMEKCH